MATGEVEEMEEEDTELESLQDLAHYVRCIPFTESDYNDVWYSPDFFLALRRGSLIDHALLLASKRKKEGGREGGRQGKTCLTLLNM